MKPGCKAARFTRVDYFFREVLQSSQTTVSGGHPLFQPELKGDSPHSKHPSLWISFLFTFHQLLIKLDRFNICAPKSSFLLQSPWSILFPCRRSFCSLFGPSSAPAHIPSAVSFSHSFEALSLPYHTYHKSLPEATLPTYSAR